MSGRSQVVTAATARMKREVRVAHVELSLSGAFVPQARTPAESEFVSSVDRWAATVWQAVEPCLVIDTAFRIVAVSPSASELLGLGKGLDAVGQPLLGGDGSLRLIDFTAGGGDLAEQEIEKIPPLLALTSERLARGLMRVQPDRRGQSSDGRRDRQPAVGGRPGGRVADLLLARSGTSQPVSCGDQRTGYPLGSSGVRTVVFTSCSI